ncbi:MAG: FAD/NAD(P)-binding oxidoreductase [Pseudomonadota bacterium]|nr:FAD/NAD(P)-binding oxidoreductase [Pseudomonadota bacterium]
MQTLNRRQFLKLAGVASALAALPRAVGAATTPARVVVVGGGFGGATAAKYIRMWGDNVQVTLVDTNATHISCILSNLVMTGALSMSRITLGYSALKTNHGVNVLQGRAVAIDGAGNTVTVSTASGNRVLPYDHLVLSPGIDFIAPPAGAWDANLTPHAWQAGAQTTLLKNQLAAMRNGDLFVMTVPKSPYRCPPGPYERACVAADYLKRKGRVGAKVIVLDANASIQAEPVAFGEAFNVTHAGMIEYVPNATVQSVVSSTRSIVTSARTVNNAKVLNFIPNQKAGAIAAGLPLNAQGFVPVNPLTYGVAGYPNIHVIGDACAVPASDNKAVPKSGHMANSEAKVCADAIVRALAGEAPDDNVTTNSACYSPITARTASWLSANYNYGDIYDAAGNVKGKGMHRVDLGEADIIGGDNYEDMFTWADSLFADSFM